MTADDMNDGYEGYECDICMSDFYAKPEWGVQFCPYCGHATVKEASR